MEKRRRARINASLTELKSLLLEAIKKEGARQNKMEKADILEMAVKHLRHIQRQQFTGHNFTGESSNDTPEVSKYQLGFHACVQEVCKYLDSNRDEDIELKTKLLNHLANSMTSADYQTTSIAPSSSSVVSSPSSSSSSSFVIHFPTSAKASDPVSPSSSRTQSSVHLESRSMMAMCPQSSEISQTDADTQERKPKLHVRNSCSDAVLQRVARGSTDGILHTVLTSTSTNSVLVKPNMLSLSTARNLLEARRPEDCRHSSSISHISSTSSGTQQGGSDTEINNNSIIVPTLLNMAGPTTFTCVQQPNQMQQAQMYQNPHQTQLFPSLPEGSSIFTSSNPLQLIPTKTVNGDVAFILSTTNLMSSSQIPSFSIPVITQPAVGHTQIFAPPIQQPAIQIALSYPPEDQQQPVTFIANSVQPILQPANLSSSITQSSITNISGQTTPLNLSSATQPAKPMTHQLMPKRALVLPMTESEHCDNNLPRRKHSSPSPFACQTGLPEGGRYSSSPYVTKSAQVEYTQLKHQTPPTSWSVTTPADPTSSSFGRQTASFQPEVHTPATLGRSVYNRSESRLADWQSQLGLGSNISSDSGSDDMTVRGHFFRPWRE